MMDPSTLIAHRGGLHTAAEVAAIESVVAAGLLPMSALPSTDAPAPGALAPPPGGLPYRRRVYGPFEGDASGPTDPIRLAMHRGQTKLCCGELDAITRALARVPGLRYVLYAGAAPGEHIAFLAELFPALEFYLVDPAEFRVPRRYREFPGVARRIHITRGLFTDAIARAWAPRAAQTIFFSDIRSGTHTSDSFEAEVAENMAMQRRWWALGGFAAASFKLRFPYVPAGAGGQPGAKVPYLDGENLLQPFGPNTSTEGRLLVWAGAGARDYDPAAYESYYFWLNNVVREWAAFDHGIELSRAPGLCYCFDCARMVQIFRAAAGAAGDAEVVRLLHRMVDATEQRFLDPPHGVQPATPPADKRLALAAEYSRLYLKKRARKIVDRAAIVPAAPALCAAIVPPGAARIPKIQLKMRSFGSS